MRSTERNGMVSRVVAILDAFGGTEPVLGVSEIARRTGLPKGSVHRIAAELVAHRLLEPVGEGGDAGYRLGIRLFELGERVPAQRNMTAIAQPIMEDLREATHLRIHLAVLDGLDVVYVVILGAGSVQVASRVGGRLPAHATGVGKAMLAYAGTAVVRARIEAGLPALTPRTITSGPALEEELRTIRSNGFAFDVEESTPGVACVAAPVFASDRRIRAALSATGRMQSLDPKVIGPAVRTAAFTLSRALRESGL